MSDTRKVGLVPVEIIPTCVPHTIEDLRASITFVRSFTDRIHIDIDDGIFVAGTTWPYGTGSREGDFDIKPIHDVIFDVHLMVSDPREIGEQFIRAGARSIIVHCESFTDHMHLKHT